MTFNHKDVYLSGKISGLDMKDVSRSFNGMEGALLEMYPECDVYNPIVPYDQYVKYYADNDWSDWMRMALQDISCCDAIIMLSGWESSRGARLEFHIANELGLEVYTEADVWYMMDLENSKQKEPQLLTEKKTETWVPHHDDVELLPPDDPIYQEGYQMFTPIRGKRDEDNK